MSIYRKQGGEGGFMDRLPDLLEKRLSRMFITTTAGNMIMGLEELYRSICIYSIPKSLITI